MYVLDQRGPTLRDRPGRRGSWSLAAPGVGKEGGGSGVRFRLLELCRGADGPLVVVSITALWSQCSAHSVPSCSRVSA